MPYFGPFLGKYKQKWNFCKYYTVISWSQSNVTSFKKSEENQSTTPMKNVELTDESSERRADDIDFIGPSVYGDS